MRKSLFRSMWLGAILLLAPTLGAQDLGAGMANLAAQDPLSGKPMVATVFYPSPILPTKPTQLGPYAVDAAPGSPVADGRFPLIALSHGHGGSHLGHHDFATFLARHGFVVVTVDHPGDNYRDKSGFGTDDVLLGRPLQLSALLDAALVSPLVGKHLDPNRIGAMGFSAGGYTVLVEAGAKPDFTLLQGYCQRHPGDKELCGIKVKFRHPELVKLADPRVKAVFAMAPLGVFFDKAGLASVKVPVFIYAAGNDQVLLVDENAGHVRDALPSPPEYRLIPGASHYVFLAPTPALAKALPDLFVDPAGVDRAAIHAQIEQDALAFFGRTLAAH